MELDVKHTKHNNRISVFFLYTGIKCAQNMRPLKTLLPRPTYTRLSYHYHVSHHHADKKIFTV